MFVNCFCPTPVHQKSDDKCGPKLPPLQLFCIQDNILFCANLQANINWIPSECRFQLRGSAGFSGWHFVSGYLKWMTGFWCLKPGGLAPSLTPPTHYLSATIKGKVIYLDYFFSSFHCLGKSFLNLFHSIVSLKKITEKIKTEGEIVQKKHLR